jgi:GTP-binding protein
MRSGCATIVALNKWDVGCTDLEDATARLEKRLRLRPPVITCSALTGRNVPGLLERAIVLADRRAARIPTPELNRFINDVVASRPPPAKRGRRLRLYYAAQVERRPPRFAIQVNDRRLITRDWAFHLENRLRDVYELEGVPLVIDFVPHSGRGRRKRSVAAQSPRA